MTTKPQTLPPLPDPPERTPEEMTNFNQMNLTGNTHHLVHHFGNTDTTLIAGEHYLSHDRPRHMKGLRYPDLIIAFAVNPAAYYRSNAYIVSEQGKPPDFVLEIASPGTAAEDMDNKPADYAALGIPEYWRFNEAPTPNRPGLAGDRLVDGQYEPMAIDILPDGRHRGIQPGPEPDTRMAGRTTQLDRPRDRSTHPHLRTGAGGQNHRTGSKATGRGPETASSKRNSAGSGANNSAPYTRRLQTDRQVRNPSTMDQPQPRIPVGPCTVFPNQPTPNRAKLTRPPGRTEHISAQPSETPVKFSHYPNRNTDDDAGRGPRRRAQLAQPISPTDPGNPTLTGKKPAEGQSTSASLDNVPVINRRMPQ